MSPDLVNERAHPVHEVSFQRPWRRRHVPEVAPPGRDVPAHARERPGLVHLARPRVHERRDLARAAGALARERRDLARGRRGRGQYPRYDLPATLRCSITTSNACRSRSR
jgi:hypothetical protein